VNLHDTKKLRARVRFDHGSSLLNSPMRGKLLSTLPIDRLTKAASSGARGEDCRPSLYRDDRRCPGLCGCLARLRHGFHLAHRPSLLSSAMCGKFSSTIATAS